MLLFVIEIYSASLPGRKVFRQALAAFVPAAQRLFIFLFTSMFYRADNLEFNGSTNAYVACCRVVGSVVAAIVAADIGVNPRCFGKECEIIDKDIGRKTLDILVATEEFVEVLSQ